MANNVGDIVKNITDDVKLIARGEIELAKQELGKAGKSLGAGGGIAAGAIYVFMNVASLFFLAVSFCFAWLLNNFVGINVVLSLCLGFLANVVLLSIVGVVLLLIAKPKFRGVKGPEKTVEEVGATSEAISQAAARGLAYVNSPALLADHQSKRAVEAEKLSKELDTSWHSA